MAPVIYLRVEPYDPDAVDGDGDGIVQERTAWERPLGTRIFDELGREIVRGATSGTAMPGSRVVDRNGNPIEYTPTYARGAGAKPRSVLGPTLGESRGGRALGATGASLGQRVGGLNQNMVPEPPPAPAPDPTPAAPVPAGPPGSPEAIRARNAEVISQIESLGGIWDFDSAPHEVRAEFIDREKAKVGMMLPQADERSGRDRITQDMDLWKRVVKEQGEKWEKMAAAERAAGRADTADVFEGRAAESRKVAEYLENTPEQKVADDLVLLIREAVDDEDTKLAVQIPHGKLDDFLATGYKTTHEVHSEHSQPRERTAYEATQGIPAEAPASVRPASGYLQFGARRRRAIELEQREMENRGVESNARVGVPDAALSSGAKSDIEGSVGGTYGEVQLILKNDVKGRTRFGMGDSYNSSLRSAPLEGATDDQILDAALATDGGKGRDTNATQKRLMDLLNIVANGSDAARLGEKPRGRITTESGGPSANESTEYWESLIFGAFDLLDVEEIVMPESKIPGMQELKNQETTAEWLKQTIRNNPGILQVIPMADLMELQQLMEEKPEAATKAMGALVNVVNAIEEKGAKDRYKEKFLAINPGLKISFTNRNGTTEFTPERYGLPEGADVDQFLQGRLEFHVARILDELRSAPAPDPVAAAASPGQYDPSVQVASYPFDDIETKVSRIKLKLEPYDPDAQDGDGDGIVQEGTAWERPLGIRLLDADGLDIEIGIISAQTISGLQYVDRDGNKVDYTPKYMSGDQADVSKPALGAIPTLGQRARGENPNEPKLPKPQRRPKVPQGQEEIEELREDVEYDEGMQEIASRLGTPDDPVDWEDPYEVVDAERLGYEGTEGQTDDEGFPLETRDAWLSAYLDDRFAADWAQWDSCRNIRKMAYLLAGIIPGAGDPNLWRSQGYFGNGWGSTDGFGDENPDVRMEQALYIMAMLRQFRQSYDEESYAYQVTRRFYRAMDTDDIDGFLKEMQEGAIVDIPIISASTRDRIGDKHILSRRDAENGRGYGDTILIEFEGEGVDFLASGELTYTYTEQDELRDLMAIAEGIREDIAYREADEDDEDFDPEQWDELLEAIDFLEQNYRDPDKYADRERARQIVRAHVADYETFGGRPYREAGVTIDEGKDSDAFWDAVEGTEDGKVKEVITGGRFEVVSVEEDETGSPYEYRVKLRQISVFDPMNPGMTTGEETPEAPDEQRVVTAKEMGANLPGDPDADLPAEMFDDPDPEVVNALDESDDQMAVRSIAHAFITGDFSWILEDLARGTSLFGEDDGVDASLADIRQFMENVREEAHRAAVREDTWDGEYLYVWRGGSVAGDEPVSVTARSREVAEGYGEAFYYRIPLQGIIYEEDRDGEPGEYVVDPGMLELVEEPERKESPVRDLITRLEREGTSGAYRTNVEAIEALYERYENGEIDDAELQELSFEVDEAARRELFDELAMVTDRETAELLSAWIDGQFDVTYSMREDVVSGRSEAILELIDESDVYPDPLFRGMALSDDELDEMVRTGRVVLPIGATSTSSSSASEYGPALFRIEGAKAFPAHLFSRVDEKEYLVSGEFEIVEIGKLADRDGNPTEKTVFVLRPTGRDFLRHREDILSNSPMPTEEGEPSTTPKSIRTAPEPELPDWVTDFYDEDDIPEEFLGVDEDGFVIISKDSDWLPDERDSVVWHGTPTRITDDYVSTAASVGSMHRYDDLFVGTENDYENHGLVDMNGEPLPHWDRVWAGTPRIASEYAGLVGAEWGDAYMYGLEVTGGMQETMDGYALEEDGHQIVRKFRFVDPEVLDEMRRDDPGILFNRHRGDGPEGVPQSPERGSGEKTVTPASLGMPDDFDDIEDLERIDRSDDDVFEAYDIESPDGYTSVGGGRIGRLPDGRYVASYYNRDGSIGIEVFDSIDDLIDNTDLDAEAEEIFDDIWREASRGSVFHATSRDNLESIAKEGLRPDNQTRGMSNRYLGRAVFTSMEPDAIESYGDAMIEIDLPRMIEEGYISKEDMSREPDFDMDDARMSLAQAFGEEIGGRAGWDGTDGRTFLFSKPIPARYLKVDGVPLDGGDDDDGTVASSVPSPDADVPSPDVDGGTPDVEDREVTLTGNFMVRNLAGIRERVRLLRESASDTDIPRYRRALEDLRLVRARIFDFTRIKGPRGKKQSYAESTLALLLTEDGIEVIDSIVEAGENASEVIDAQVGRELGYASREVAEVVEKRDAAEKAYKKIKREIVAIEEANKIAYVKNLYNDLLKESREKLSKSEKANLILRLSHGLYFSSDGMFLVMEDILGISREEAEKLYFKFDRKKPRTIHKEWKEITDKLDFNRGNAAVVISKALKDVRYSEWAHGALGRAWQESSAGSYYEIVDGEEKQFYREIPDDATVGQLMQDIWDYGGFLDESIFSHYEIPPDGGSQKQPDGSELIFPAYRQEDPPLFRFLESALEEIKESYDEEELRKIFAKRDEIEEQLSELRTQTLLRQEGYKAARRRITLEVLRRNRPSLGGGDLKQMFDLDKIAPKTGDFPVTKEQILEALDEISRWLPEEWLERLRDPIHRIEWGPRGHYSYYERTLRLSGARNWRQTLAHEIMHAVQYHSNLTDAERLYLSRRAQSMADTAFVPQKYRSDEEPWFNLGFNNEYASKVYIDKVSELSTMSFEVLRGHDIPDDPELLKFMLGVLLTL